MRSLIAYAIMMFIFARSRVNNDSVVSCHGRVCREDKAVSSAESELEMLASELSGLGTVSVIFSRSRELLHYLIVLHT